MPLNIQAIRALNRLELHITCCSDPAGRITSATNDVLHTAGGANVWSFGMYSEGGLSLNAGIQAQDAADKAGSSKFARSSLAAIGSGVLAAGWGVVPQLDYSRKFLFQGSEPLSFNMTCYLVLENDVVLDFFDPLIRLFFLTYPRRTVQTLGASAVTGLDNVTSWADKEKASYETLHNTADSSLWDKMITGALSGFSFGAEVVGDTLEWVTKNADKYLGGVYGLIAPPTFWTPLSNHWSNCEAPLSNGVKVNYYPSWDTGLAVSYGRTYIPNVYVKSLAVEVPKLYYEGGFSQVLKVSIGFETLRRATVDNMYNAVIGRVTQG